MPSINARLFASGFLLVMTGCQALFAADLVVCPRAHAHNDYQHTRPLLDALEQGFGSVEADIHLVDGQLLVAHDREDVSPDRTLQSLYLDPLRQRIEANQGSVHGDEQEFTLLIDIKSDGEQTYRALHSLLSDYRSMLTQVTESGLQRGAVRVVVSGDRAVDAIAADMPRYVGIDGRVSDLDSEHDADLYPMISDHWGKTFRWRGVNDFYEADRKKLENILQRAHAKGQRVRFWAIPDHRGVWSVLDEAGVDLINTDDLSGLSQYFQSK